MVVARIESLILERGIDDAVARAKAYIDAGADGILIHSKQEEPHEIFEFCGRYSALGHRVPLFAVPTTYNRVTERELIEQGISVVIYANQLIRAAYPAMVEAARSILTQGRSAEADDRLMPIAEILGLIPGSR